MHCLLHRHMHVVAPDIVAANDHTERVTRRLQLYSLLHLHRNKSKLLTMDITTRKTVYANSYDFFMVPTNNFNRYKK
jgi:hypothetical protein